MAVTSLPVLHHQPEADLATATSIVTGWRHGKVYSGPRNCRLAPCYETGLGGPAVHSITITGVLYWYYLYTLVLL